MTDNNLDVWYFKGNVVFSNLEKPDEQYKMYGLTISVDDKTFEEFKASGIQTKVREDNRSSQKLVSFKRPSRKVTEDEITRIDPPFVMDADKKNMNAGAVDRGSEVIAKVLTYKTAKGIGHRLQGIMVTKLKEAPDVHNSTEHAPF